MAFRNNITTRATLITRRFHASFSHILHNEDDHAKASAPNLSTSQFGNGYSSPCGLYNRIAGLGSLFTGRTCSSFGLQMGLGSSFSRYMSNTAGEGSGKVDHIGYVADVITEETVEAVVSRAPAVSEVALAAADSSYPVAALQYLIDAVHSTTGLNWWASIALTTLLIRGPMIPLLINQLKATSKLNLMRPQLEKLKQQMQDKAMDPNAVAESQKKMQALFDEYGVSPFTPLRGLLLQGPIFICFFLAIRNMAEKVPSFKSGGVLWFTDLTTPDNLFILPVLTSLSFWITVECNMQEGLEGNPVAGTMKKFSRVLAVVGIPLMAAFPKAVFCYWLTSNLFSLAYGSVIRQPAVKKLLNLPEIPVPPTSASQSDSSLLSMMKKDTTVKAEPSSPSESSTKVADKRTSSPFVISQRLRSLEKQVKRRKKHKG